MKNDYIEKIDQTIRVLRIINQFSFLWFDKKEQLSAKFTKDLLPDTLREYFINMLTLRLYKNFYCAGYPARSLINSHYRAGSLFSKSRFVQQISEANCGRGHIEPGWDKVSEKGNTYILEKNELRITAEKKFCTAISEDKTNGIYMPKEYLNLSPGFYLAMSERFFLREAGSRILRIYWNLIPEGAAKLMKEITLRFNKAAIPFRLKVLNNPAEYFRCDSAVLYLDRQNFDTSKQLLANIHSDLYPYLKEHVPAFTKKLSKGLGLSEDPFDGKSFGMSRCRILAESVCNLSLLKIRKHDEKINFILDSFAAQKIDMNTPYLNPDSVDDYDLNLISYKDKNVLKRTPIESNSIKVKKEYINVAYEIGLKLCRNAIWHNKKCNWMGFDTNDSSKVYNNMQHNLIYKALGPDLYSGTAGAALFLTELHINVNEKQIHDTATGAIMQSLSLAYKYIESGITGLYNGSAGIAFVAAYSGILLNNNQLIEESKKILDAIIRSHEFEKRFDIISGSAGIILVFVIAYKLFNIHKYLDFAILLGNDLIKCALAEEDNCSWNEKASIHRRPLTGFSHGTAGISYSLLELFGVTGNESFKDYCMRGFNYENKTFDKQKRLWPDFRDVPAKADLKVRHLNFPAFWCHGASGIALSRIAAYNIIGNEKLKAEANNATAIAMSETDTMLNTESSNFCLCHGLAGNADVMLLASEMKQNCYAEEARIMAERIGIEGIRKFSTTGKWQLGDLGCDCPGLMNGLSGVGHFYLRLHNTSTPSALVLCSKEFVDRLFLEKK